MCIKKNWRKIIRVTGIVLLVCGILSVALEYFLLRFCVVPEKSFFPPSCNPAPEKTSFRVAFLGDNGMMESPLDIIAMDIQKRNVDFVVCLGDFVHPAMPGPIKMTTDLFRRIFTVPIYATPGNHDVYDSENQYYFSSVFGPAENCFAYGDTLFILLASPDTQLSAEQLKWLDYVLKTERPKYRRCVLATHVPPVTQGRFDQRKFRLSEENAAELKRITDAGNVDLIMCGHVHYAMEVPFGKSTVCVVPTSGQSSRNKENPAYGYTLVDFHADGSTTREVIYHDVERNESVFLYFLSWRLQQRAIAFSIGLAMLILGGICLLVSHEPPKKDTHNL